MSNYKKILLLFISILIVAVSIYLYKLYDINGQIKDVTNEIQKEEELLALIDKQLEDTTEDLNKEEIIGLYRQLPSSEGVPQLFSFLQQSSDKNDIEITNITFDEIKESKTKPKNDEGSTYQTVVFNLKAESSSYESIRLFIQDLYDYDRLINIDGVKLLEQNDKVVTELALMIYYAPSMQGYIPELELIETYAPSEEINPIK